MKILDKIRSRRARFPSGGGAEEKGRVYDRAKDGTPLDEGDVVGFVEAEYERRLEERRPFEAQWTLNANFLAGNQHCGIHPVTLEIEDYAAEHDYMEHGVFNRIAPLMDTRLANLKTVSYAMTVSPRSNELDDYEKSLVATKLLSYTQSAGDFEVTKNRLLLWSELCGSAAIISWWDKAGGQILASVSGERDIHEGGIAYGLLTPYEIFPDSLTAPDVADQRSMLICQVKSAEEIYDLYGIEVDGEDVDTYALLPGGAASGYGDMAPISLRAGVSHDSARVMTYFERPSARYPDGRMIVTAGGRLVWYGNLPYRDIPIVMLRCKEVPGRFFGRSVIEELIPLQRAYNGTKNKIHDYIRTCASGPLLVPEGAVADIEELAARGLPPGEILEYDAQRGRPESMAPPSLSSEVRRECERLASDMEYVSGVSSLMVYGATPTGVTSGTAIESLRSIDNTRLALSGENLRTCVRLLGVLWLKLYRTFASGYRTLEIVGGNDAGSVLTWCAQDINSFDIVFDAENELLVSKSVQKENFLSALSLGLLSDEEGKVPREVRVRALEMMRIGNYADLLGENELHLQRARREGDMLFCGEAPALGAYDDDGIHIAEHRRFVLQLRYEALRRRHPDLCAAFEAHLAEHLRREGMRGELA